VTRGCAREHRAVLGGTITASHLGRRLTAAGAVAAVALTAAVATQPTPAHANQPAAHDAVVARANTPARASRGALRTILVGPVAPAEARTARTVRAGRPAAGPHRTRVRTAARVSGTVRNRQGHRRAVHRRAGRRIIVRGGRGAGAVVAYAYAALGSPYRFGAAGGGAYDCSGLTMRAYAAAGLRLPHRAAAQSGRTVGSGQARPGDLVKWGSYHVGIYVGHGYVIHAPKPGDRVKKSRLWGSYRIQRLS
jgi:cell wall-associated NlpC family hydrolase